MKKIFLLTVILIQTTIVFGQNVTYAWGPWVQNPCFKGLQSRSKVRDYNSSAKQFTWDIEIKNNYSSKVSFNFDIKNSSIDGRTSINAGGIDKSWTLNPSETNLYVEFSKVCFDPNDYCSVNSNGTQNKGYKCYAECDNGVPNVPKLCGNINEQTVSGSQQNTQQNNLSEYNRSKADLERQVAEKNAEGQRKSQNYTAAVSAGIAAHNSGNYGEAKRQFSVALNNCNTEEARQKAQEYYNKSADAEKSQAKIKAVGDFTNKTAELISYFSNRKNALRNSLSKEDADALIEIVNAENPAEYTQNIIQIFTDLGYTYRKTEKDSYGTTVTMNNDPANINDFMLIFIRQASYSDYNSIGFSYHRREKLLSQLSVLGSNLEGYKFPEIKGVPPSRRDKVDAIFRKEQEEKNNKEQQVIEINKWVKDFAVTDSDTKTDSVTVDAVLNRYIEAVGGIQRLREVQNVVINEDYGDGYDHKIIIAPGKYARISTKPDGKAYSKTVFGGKKGYDVFLGDKRKLRESEKQEFAKKEPIDILAIQKLSLTTGKILQFNRKDCFTLINEERVESKENLFNIDTYFFDIATRLLVGKTRHSNGSYNNRRYEIYDEYENVDGILFYTKEITFYESDKRTTTVIDGQLRKNAFVNKRKIKVNQNITDKDFE